MRSGTIAVLLGCLLVQQLQTLPELPWKILVVLLLPLLLLDRPLKWLAAFGVGFLWAAACGQVLLEQRPPSEWMDRDLRVTGTVVGLPTQKRRFSRFDLDVEQVWLSGTQLEASGRWRLTDYRTTWDPSPGDRLELLVRLKPPRRFRNPGSFDYQAYLFFNGIAATGRVLAVESVRDPLSMGLATRVDRVRQRLTQRIEAHLGPLGGGMIAALAVGDRQRVSLDDTTTLRRTGTAHLLAISGLHISMVAGLAFLLGGWMWRLSARACEWVPAPRIAAAAAMLAALLYAALAGFSLPTQRACVMLLVGALAIWLDREPMPSQIVAVALAAVLVLDPLAPGSGGFWLSFLAVALIFYLLAMRLWPPTVLYGWVRIQLLLVLALLPLHQTILGQVAPLSVPANLVAIPWVGATVVPATLLGVTMESLWPGLGYGPWWFADQCLMALMHFLRWLEGIDGLVWNPGRSPWAVLSITMGVVLLLLPRGVPGRWLGVIFLLPLVLGGAADQAFRVALLDTGRGFAAVLHKDGQALVYDAGPRFGPTLDAGSAAVLPYLRWYGVSTIKALVVSRNVAARTGGIRSVREHMPTLSTLAPIEDSLPLTGKQPCENHVLEWGGGFVVRVEQSEAPLRCVLTVSRYGAPLVVLDPDHSDAHPAIGGPLLVTWDASSDSGRLHLSGPDAEVPSRPVASAVARPERPKGPVALSAAEHGTIELVFDVTPGAATAPRIDFPSLQRFWHH